MPESWLSIRVELLSGRGQDFWPYPGRLLAVGPRQTFADLAAAIDAAFARWDRGHLCIFDLGDGTKIAPSYAEFETHTLDFAGQVITRTVKPGQVFRYLFDFGDDWAHRCEVDSTKIDPLETLGVVPDGPTAFWGWGTIPDQYGRRWDGDDGGSEPPPAPTKPHPMSFFTWPDLPEWA